MVIICAPFSAYNLDSSGKSKEENLDFIKGKIDKYSGKQDLVIFPEYSMIKPDFNDRNFMIDVSESITGQFVEEIRSMTMKREI